MKPWIAALWSACLLAGAPAFAQDAKAPPAAQSPEQTRLEQLVARFKKHQADCLEEYKKATTDEARSAALERRAGRTFLPEFQTLADAHPGTDAAGQALLWMLRIGQERAAAGTIVARLLEQHMESTCLSELPSLLGGSAAVIGASEVERVLGELIEYSPHAEVQGQALFVRGSNRLQSKTAATASAGRKDLERVVAEFATLEDFRGPIGERASGILFKLDNLQVGKVAPDFESVDENGAKWKLSDYRGKVILLDFWGYW